MNAYIWALLAALIWGVVPLFEKWGLVSVKPMPGLFYRCVGVLLGTLILALFLVKPSEIKSVGMRSALFLILGGFLASFVAQICFYNSLKLGEISRIVPISGSYPLIAFLLGVFLLGESVSWVKCGGAFLIVAGVWLLKAG